MSKNKAMSVRLPDYTHNWISEQAKLRGISKSDVIKSALQSDITAGSPTLPFEGGGTLPIRKNTVDDDVFELLASAGIATGAGIAGYHIAGYIREKLDKNEDKGMQMVTGLIIGLGTLLVMPMLFRKRK